MTVVAEIKSSDGKEFINAFKEEGSTRGVYRTGLGVFLSFYRQQFGKAKTLENFLDEVEKDKHKSRRERKRFAQNVLREFVRWCKKQGYKPKTVRTYVSSVQSLAAYYDLQISARYINMPSSNPFSQKFPWTVQEAADFISLLPSIEAQTIAVTVFQSGLGPADIYGLTWSDIKYEFTHRICPLCFDFSRQKTDVPFMTFIGIWGFSLLRQHLEGKRFRLNQELFTMPLRTLEHQFQQLGKKKVGTYEGHNPCRLYGLRSAFRTILGDAKLNETYIEFFMGHNIAEQKRVYVSKSRDGWRKTYAEYERFLTPKSF